MIAIQGILDIEALYTNVTSDQRIARMNYMRETVEIARLVGLRIPKGRMTEIELVRRTRGHLMGRQPQRPCSGCILEGRRWYKIHTGEPLLLSVDTASMVEAYSRADDAMQDAFNLIREKFPYVDFRVANLGEVADVRIRSERLDGRNGTLGFATTYSTPTSEDLDVGGDRWVSAELVCDSAEYWTYDFFVTVFVHEMMHILGLGHAPETVDDIMLAFYAGARRTFGEWTEAEMFNRYHGRLPA